MTLFLFNKMITKILSTKSEFLENFDLLSIMYPSLTIEEYSTELDEMMKHDYLQLAIYDQGKCIGLTGIWVGYKLWCGKYLELDNIVVDPEYRSKGIGQHIFNEVKTMAEDEGCTIMALDSYTSNFKAHRFFYNQGFTPTGFHFINILDRSKIR